MSEVVKQSVEFIANPVQRQFIESRAQADLMSSRKGEGKSAGLVWSIFYHTSHNPGATWIVIRDTFENLKRTTLQEFLRWFPDKVFGHYSAGDKVYVWDEARCGLRGKVYFMGVEDDVDASKIASMPLAGVAIDEPSGAAGESSGVSEFVFDTAIAQLRQPGMKWYAVKLAQNNPDESHWTFRRFVSPGTPPDESIALLPMQESGYRAWQTREPENVDNLPPGYYENMARTWAHRPDLVRRFVEGKYGFQQVGRAVTPEWSDEMHLVSRLQPVKGSPLYLLWDGGLNPTCVITQVTPMGFWLILESHVGDGIGAYQLIEDVIKPAMTTRYRGFTWTHVGDPNLKSAEQSDSRQSAAALITRELGGRFLPGPIEVDKRVDPLRSVLRRTLSGRGVVQVDRDKAKDVWHALRGGWHWHIARGGTVGQIKKNMHSHPGDCMGYGASHLFPLGKLQTAGAAAKMPIKQSGDYFNRASHPGTSIGMARPGARLPRQARRIGT